MKATLKAAHATARTGCIRAAKTVHTKRLCGQIPPPAPGVKRTSSVVSGFQQYGFVCHYESQFGGFWSSSLFTGVDDFPNNSRDFLLWLQFPPGLDELPGGTYVMTVFASVYCDVYGSVAYPGNDQTPPPITPDVPAVVDACGTANDTYSVPDAVPVPLFRLFGPDETMVNLVDPDVGIMYLVDGVVTAPGTYHAPAGGSRTVTIQALATTSRYRVRNPDSWTIRFTDEQCPRSVVPVKPTIANTVCGPDNDVIDRLDQITGLTYDYGRWQNNRRTVTATAWDGYYIPANTDGSVSWTYVDDAAPCPISVTTRAPTVQEVCGPTNDVITVAATEGVTYTVGTWNSNGTIAITAAANPGYVIAPGAGIAWQVTDGAKDCPIVDPPLRPTVLSIRMVGRTVRVANKKVVYGLIIRNTGRTTAQDVVIKDPIPAGLSVVGRPVDATIRKGVIVWHIGDLQPGSWIYLEAQMRPVRNRTVRRCNSARSVAANAQTVSARRCTRFIRVAGTSFGGVTG